MAKKRKGARKTTSRKRAASRRAPTRSAAVTIRGNQLDFKPLKRNIKAHIDRLSRVKEPTPEIRAAIESLDRVQRELTETCLPTMALPLT